MFFHHHGWGFFCHSCWRINIYQLPRNDAFSIGSCWREAFALPYEVWKVRVRSQMGVYTSRMIRCCLHHYSRNCALCLSLALFMLMLNGIFPSASSPRPLHLFFCLYSICLSVIRSHWPCHINQLWWCCKLIGRFSPSFSSSDMPNDKDVGCCKTSSLRQSNTLPMIC